MNFDKCKQGLHPLKIITSTAVGYGEEKVVRWCPLCGAVVVDCDIDNRTQPGYYKELKIPKITEEKFAKENLNEIR